MGELESQLIRVPHGTHDDLPDAEQGLVQLLQNPRQQKTKPQEENEFDRLKNFFKPKPKQVGRFSVGKGQYELPAIPTFH